MSVHELQNISFGALIEKVKDRGRFKSQKIHEFAVRRLEEIQEAHEWVSRVYQESGNGAKDSLLPQVNLILEKCTEGFPLSTKVRQLEELKLIFALIQDSYQDFQLFLTREESSQEEAKKVFLSDCGAKKSQLLRNEQKEYERSSSFQTFLEKIDQRFNESPREKIYFAYAWPTDSRYEKESWVQPFLKNLQAHLTKAGFPTVQLDIVSNRYGANIYQFMEEARTSGYVLLFGTESLLDEFSKGISAVCTELIHILRKREEDGKENVHRVFPILLSGEHRSAFPPEYERFSTIRDWRDHSYLHNFQQLFLELLDLPPGDYQFKLEKYWKDISPLEAPSISDWYQQQREAIEACKRNNDKVGLRTIEVSRNPPLAVDESPPHPTFTERLKEHYTTRSTISVLTFREKGKWELTLPVDSLYTKLAMITEEERDERRDLATFLDDGRLPTHETIFKAKKEVVPEEIFKLAKGKRAVIYGSAGIGKTTFTTMLLYKWANGEFFTEFQTVFCIRLRNLTKNFYPKGRVYHAADILNREYESIGLDRIDSDPKTSLMILDGWDELPPETREGGHLAQAFEELQEYYPNLLITSRPGAIDVDATEFEILGFSDPQIGTYIDRFFHTDASKAAGIKRFIRQNPLARSLAHIPINLSILCALYDEDDTLFNSEALLTNSVLYDRIINQFYKIFLKRRGASLDEIRSCPSLSFHPDIAPLVSCLEEIAYKAAIEGKIYTNEREIARIVYKKKYKIEEVKKLGLYRVENHQGSFIHLTFQEYFAALYISRFYESSETRPQALEIVRRIKFNAKFVRILSMVAGVLSNSENQEALQSYFDDLHSEPRDHAEDYELILLASCFDECKDLDSISQYPNFILRVKESIIMVPRKELLEPLFMGNRKLLGHPVITEQIRELLVQEEYPYPLEIFRLLHNITLHLCFLNEEILDIISKFEDRREYYRIISEIKENISSEPKLTFLEPSSLEKGSDQLNPSKAGFVEDDLIVEISRLSDPSVEWSGDASKVELLVKAALSSERGKSFREEVIKVLLSLLSNTSIGQEMHSLVIEKIELLSEKKRSFPSEFVVTEEMMGAASLGKLGESAFSSLLALALGKHTDSWVKSSVSLTLIMMNLKFKDIRKMSIQFLNTCRQERKFEQLAGESIASKIEQVHDSFSNPRVDIISIIQKYYDGLHTSYNREDEFPLLFVASCYVPNWAKNEIERLISFIIDERITISNPPTSPNLRTAIGLLALSCISNRIDGQTIYNILSGSAVENRESRHTLGLVLSKILTELDVSLGRSCFGALLGILQPSENKVLLQELLSTLGSLASRGESKGKYEDINKIFLFLSSPDIENQLVSSAVEVMRKIASVSKEAEYNVISSLVSLFKELNDESLKNLIKSLIQKIQLPSQTQGLNEVICLLDLLDIHERKNALLNVPEVLEAIVLNGGTIGEESTQALVSLLRTTEDRDVQIGIVEVLKTIVLNGRTIGEEGTQALVSLLRTAGDRDVQIVIVEALKAIVLDGRTIGEEGVQALLSLLRTGEDRDVQIAIVEALEIIDLIEVTIGEEGTQALVSLLRTGEDRDLQIAIVEALETISLNVRTIGEESTQALVSLLRTSEDGDVQIVIVEALKAIVLNGRTIGEESTQALVCLLRTTEDRDVQIGIVKVLTTNVLNGRTIGEESTQALVSLLRTSEDGDVQIGIVEALETIVLNGGTIGEESTQVLVCLLRTTEDRDVQVDISYSIVALLLKMIPHEGSNAARLVEILVSQLVGCCALDNRSKGLIRSLKEVVKSGISLRKGEIEALNLFVGSVDKVSLSLLSAVVTFLGKYYLQVGNIECPESFINSLESLLFSPHTREDVDDVEDVLTSVVDIFGYLSLKESQMNRICERCIFLLFVPNFWDIRPALIGTLREIACASQALREKIVSALGDFLLIADIGWNDLSLILSAYKKILTCEGVNTEEILNVVLKLLVSQEIKKGMKVSVIEFFTKIPSNQLMIRKNGIEILLDLLVKSRDSYYFVSQVMTIIRNVPSKYVLEYLKQDRPLLKRYCHVTHRPLYTEGLGWILGDQLQ